MSKDVLITVESVSKRFCRDLKRSLWYGIQDISTELCCSKSSSLSLREDEFWALNDITFELRRGECLGLIGSNGAGKSTLLKLLNGLMKPDHGRIIITGVTGALIELNAGFNPILTGRENIFINASVLGVPKRRVDQILDEIINFSGIGEFIDTPVQYYSSGMKVRLGFSIATLVIKPDVLLLDEVLAVGDAHFRSKCYNRIGRLRENAAVIFVSHSMDQVAQICDACLLLEKGRMSYFGEVSEGIQRYLEGDSESDGEAKPFEIVEDPVIAASLAWDRLDIDYGGTIILTAKIETSRAIPGALVHIPFYDREETVVAEWNSRRIGQVINLEQGCNNLQIQLGPLYLKGGTYKIAFILNDSTGNRYHFWSFKKYVVCVNGSVRGKAAYQLG